MRTLLLNTFFILVAILGAQSALATTYKDFERGLPARGTLQKNQPAFENIEYRLDGSTLFHDVGIVPDCDESLIKLVDNGVEIRFFASKEVCLELISDNGWSNCLVRTGSALVEKVSLGLGLLTRYEITKVDHFKEGCVKLHKSGKATKAIIIRDVELLGLCDENKIKLIDQGFEISFRARQDLCRDLASHLGTGGCGVLIGDATIKKMGDGIFSWDEIIKTENLRDGCQPVAPIFPN